MTTHLAKDAVRHFLGTGRLISVLCLAMAAVCISGCDPLPTLIVHGKVDRTKLDTTTIWVDLSWSGYGNCVPEYPHENLVEARKSDEDGYYSAWLSAGFGHDYQACVMVVAREANSVYAPDTVRVPNVWFRTRPDSLRVDLHLTATNGSQFAVAVNGR